MSKRKMARVCALVRLHGREYLNTGTTYSLMPCSESVLREHRERVADACHKAVETTANQLCAIKTVAGRQQDAGKGKKVKMNAMPCSRSVAARASISRSSDVLAARVSYSGRVAAHA